MVKCSPISAMVKYKLVRLGPVQIPFDCQAILKETFNNELIGRQVITKYILSIISIENFIYLIYILTVLIFNS